MLAKSLLSEYVAPPTPFQLHSNVPKPWVLDTYFVVVHNRVVPIIGSDNDIGYIS